MYFSCHVFCYIWYLLLSYPYKALSFVHEKEIWTPKENQIYIGIFKIISASLLKQIHLFTGNYVQAGSTSINCHSKRKRWRQQPQQLTNVMWIRTHLMMMWHLTWKNVICSFPLITVVAYIFWCLTVFSILWMVSISKYIVKNNKTCFYDLLLRIKYLINEDCVNLWLTCFPLVIKHLARSFTPNCSINKTHYYATVAWI